MKREGKSVKRKKINQYLIMYASIYTRLLILVQKKFPENVGLIQVVS